MNLLGKHLKGKRLFGVRLNVARKRLHERYSPVLQSTRLAALAGPQPGPFCNGRVHEKSQVIRLGRAGGTRRPTVDARRDYPVNERSVEFWVTSQDGPPHDRSE